MEIIYGLIGFVLLMAFMGGIVLKIRKDQQPALPAAPPQPPALPDGSQSLGMVGPFQVIGKLPSGGFADVFKGFDSQANAYVAIKVLKADRMKDAVILSRFETEGLTLKEIRQRATLAGVTDPRLALLPGFKGEGRLEKSGRAYFVMEFMEGKRLDDVIRSGGRLSDENILMILKDIALALEVTHEAGYCHLDVKPLNILISFNGTRVQQARLIDFGAAVKFAGGLSGGRAFTRPYVSPEYLQGAAISTQCDYYSLGVVLYEMLAGKIYAGHDSLPHGMLPGISRPMQALLTTLLQHKPELRPNSYAEIKRQMGLAPAGKS